MTYPNKKQILSIMSDIEKSKTDGQIKKIKPLPKNSNPLTQWKFKISQKMAEFKTIKGLSLDEMSSLLNTDKANVSRILNGHIENVTLDKLVQYFEIILIASKNKNASKEFHQSAEKFFNLSNIKFA